MATTIPDTNFPLQLPSEIGPLIPNNDPDSDNADSDCDNDPELVRKYPADPSGNITPHPSLFDTNAVYQVLREKSTLPKEQWTKKIGAGVILLLQNDKKRAKSNIPPYIPLTSAIEIISSMIQGNMEKFHPSGVSNTDSEGINEELEPTKGDFEFYATSMELLDHLHELSPRSKCLLPTIPLARSSIRYVCMNIVNQSINWLSNTKKKLREMEKNALTSVYYSCRLINRLLSEELRKYSRKSERIIAGSVPFGFQWLNILCKPEYASKFLHFYIQSGKLVHTPTPSNPNRTLYWDVYEGLSTFLFHLCFVDDFIQQLVKNSECEDMLKTMESILKIDSTESHIARAKFHSLRILTVLGENEEPYFLDYASKMETSFTIARLIITEAANTVSYAPEVKSIDENALDNPHIIAREAFRFVELLAYDSNFVTLVVDNATSFLLEFLSVSPDQFETYFNPEHTYQRYTTVLVFRMVANLHCYNPEVSPITQKDQLIRKVHDECSTIYALNEENEVVRVKNIVVPYMMANLSILFKRVTENFSFTLQELELWRSFMAALEQQLGCQFTNTGKKRRRGKHIDRRRVYSRSSSDEYEERGVEEDVEEEFIPGQIPSFSTMPPTFTLSSPTTPTIIKENPIGQPLSGILRGVCVSFGKVTDPVELKNLVQYHGGSVFEYVTKSVTHVVCGEDTESVAASNSKIQSAASKQLPAVSEKLIYDSISSGRLLPEKGYLVSNHPYNSRYISMF